jgi:16S rRNA (adenine1518-N6/adenine1519-N6)-dimethyltransferase
MQHRARKRFGQNFLRSTFIITKIIEAIAPQAHESFLEIGPGLGALTLPLLQYVPHLFAVEIDRDLIAHLERYHPKLTLHGGDALKMDYHQWGKNLRIIGNLPYNISTPLLFHLQNFSSSIQDMHFMLQKEVVDRLAAPPNTRDYGRLSVMMQHRFQVTSLFEVPPEAFEPPPKVQSAVVRLVPHPQGIWSMTDERFFAQVVTQAFSQRRKTLRNTLSPLIVDKAWEKNTNFDLNRRAETLTIEEYIELTRQLGEQSC